MTTQPHTTDAFTLRAQLDLLFTERAVARAEGLGGDAHYMADLDDEIAATRAAYVGAAVTEIATLRGQLGGRLQG